MASSTKKPIKNIPTILPMGFGIRVTEQKMIIIEFIDNDYDENRIVIGSFALDKKTVGVLTSKLTEVVKDLNEDKK